MFNSSAIFVFAASPDKGGGGPGCSCSRGAGWPAGRGQKASVAASPAASATISHLPACCGVRFLPKVGRRARCQSVIVRPACSHGAGLVTMLPAFAAWLSVIQDIVSLGDAINPFPAHQDIQLSPAGEADWEGGPSAGEARAGGSRGTRGRGRPAGHRGHRGLRGRRCARGSIPCSRASPYDASKAALSPSGPGAAATRGNKCVRGPVIYVSDL